MFLLDLIKNNQYNTVIFSDLLKCDSFSKDKKLNAVILYWTSADYYIQQGVSIINLNQKNSSCYDNLFIFEYNLSDLQKQFLLSIENRIIFVRYNKDDFKRELNLKECIDYDYLATQYAKHLIFLMLKFSNKVLSLEQDIIIIGDLSYYLSGKNPALTFDNDFNHYCLKFYGTSFTDITGVPDIPENIVSGNAGCYYVDSTIDYEKSYSLSLIIKKKLIDYKNGNITPAIDELTVPYVFFYLNPKTRLLDNSLFNSYDLIKRIDDNVILYHAQSHKPWKSNLVREFYPQWKFAYVKWLELGGYPIYGLNIDNHRDKMFDCNRAFVINKFLIYLMSRCPNSCSYFDTDYLSSYSPKILDSIDYKFILNGFELIVSFPLFSVIHFNIILNKINLFYHMNLVAFMFKNDCIFDCLSDNKLVNSYKKDATYDNFPSIIDQYCRFSEFANNFSKCCLVSNLSLPSSLSSCNDIYLYLSLINYIKSDYLIVLSTSNIIGQFMPKAIETFLNYIGFRKFCNHGFCMYTGVIFKNNVCFDSLGVDLNPVDYTSDSSIPCDLHVSSNCWDGVGGLNRSEIIINEVNYSVNQRGINFVVFDVDNSILLDSVGFDFHLNKEGPVILRRNI